MTIKLGKDSSIKEPQGTPVGKKSQTAKLILLLLVAGGFAYLYFFTGLINPEEVPVTTPPPHPTQQAVRMPLPPRTGTPDKPEPASAGGETPKTVAVSPPPVAAPPVTPAKPAPPVTAAKPVTPAPPTLPTPPVGAAPPVRTVSQPPSATRTVKSDKTDAAPPTANSNKIPVKKIVKKHAPAAAPARENGTPPRWSLVAENYVLEEKLADDLGRLRKAGLTPSIKTAAHKVAPMNRLRVAEYGTRTEAQSALQRLKRITSDAFIIEQSEKFIVYAGSYLQTEAAHVERDRLKLAGVPTTVTRVEIAIPTQSLIIGPFASMKEADTALDTVKKLGIAVLKVQK